MLDALLDIISTVQGSHIWSDEQCQLVLLCMAFVRALVFYQIDCCNTVLADVVAVHLWQLQWVLSHFSRWTWVTRLPLNSRFSKQLWLWLLLLNHILHLHLPYLLNNRIYLPFPAIPSYQMEVGINPIGDRPILLTASADEGSTQWVLSSAVKWLLADWSTTACNLRQHIMCHMGRLVISLATAKS